MCGRYLVITEDEIIEMRAILEELNNTFGSSDSFNIFNQLPQPLISNLQLDNDPFVKYAKNHNLSNASELFPSQTAPVIVFDNDALSIKPMKWGFTKWDGKGNIINARSENIENNSFFKDSFSSRRCIIPSRGFFEWSHNNTKPNIKHATFPTNQTTFFDTQEINNDNISKNTISASNKFLIRKPNNPFFFMAGVYQLKENIHEFAILTMPANRSVESIHNRMPVSIDLSEFTFWLNKNILFDELFTKNLQSKYITTPL